MSLLLLGAGPGTDTYVDGYSYTNTEAQDFVARGTAAGGTPPDSTRKGHIDTFFTAIKAVGIAKFDLVKLYAAHDTIFSRCNLISSSFTSSIVGTPTFTTDRGWNGWSISPAYYLDTTYQPSSGGTLIDQNNLNFGTWVQDNIADVGNDAGLTTLRWTARDTSDDLLARCSATTGDTVDANTTDAKGFLMMRREVSGVYHADKNGVEYGASISRTSGSQGTGNIFIGCRSNAGTPENATARRIAAVCAGSWLTAAEATDTYDAFAAYMTAVGA